MDYTTLGASGTSVSRFALGTMTFGREASEEDSFAQLDRFTELGGNLIDTADVYAGGESERIVGRWLARQAPGGRDQVVLATKARFPMGAGPNDVGLSRKHLAAALDASLGRLGVETIDLYQVHAYDPYTPLPETMAFLSDAVSAGKIHYAGLSNFTGWQLQRAVDVAELRGGVRPVSIQPQYNLLAREIEWEVVPAALANGLGILPWSPLGGGWLTGKYSSPQAPRGSTRLGDDAALKARASGGRVDPSRVAAIVDAVREIASERSASMAQVALAWVRSRPGVTSVILGARTIDHLNDNLGAVDLHLTDAEMQRLTTVSEPVAGAYPYGETGSEQHTRRLGGGR